MWTLEIPTKNDTDVSVGRQQMEQTKKGINIIEIEPPVNSKAELLSIFQSEEREEDIGLAVTQ